MGTWVPEFSKVPEHLRNEQLAVENEIRIAFEGVTRDGGVSWSEAEVIDSYGSPEERSAARLKDIDRTWEELVDNPVWLEEPGIGGFTFLDAIGWRYYIAPAMIRCTRRGGGEFIGYSLERSPTRHVGLITPQQANAIARFLRFMIAVHEAVNDKIYGESWNHAYDCHWRQRES